jgi:cell division protein FtsA
MSRNRIIASMDIGSSKIRVVVGVVDEKTGMPNILGMGLAPTGSGIRKSLVIDVDETINALASALEDAERMAGEPIHHVYLGVGGHHIDSTNSKGVIATNNPSREISEDDMDRALEAAQALSIPANRTILKIIPRSFAVDEQRGIKFPVGMTGIRLEVDAHIVSGLTPAIKNLEKCVLQAGVDINDMIPNVLAPAESVLTKRQKELGVVIVDIGCGSTTIAIYEEGTILHSGTVPLGGENVTSDIAIGLKTTLETAERIKIEYGTCIPEEVQDREMIDLSLISKIDIHQVSRKTLSQIIQARYHEIFSMVKTELAKVNRDGMLPAGVILTGAASKMPGVVDLARETMNLPVQIGFPQNFEGIVDKIDDPSYSTAIGLLVWGSRLEETGLGMSFDFSKLKLGKLSETIKGWAKNLMP